MYDLIIIGGGPAGLTAAVYSIRKRLNVLLLTKDLGGKTNYRLHLPWIDDYPVIRGLEIVNKFKSELEYLDFSRKMEGVEKVDQVDNRFLVTTTGGEELSTRAVIIASGTKQERLKVPGEKEFIMRGLCYSALSYAPLFIDRTTAVIGDSELACRSAAELSTIAHKVYMVAKKFNHLDTPLGSKLRVADNVSILEGYDVREVRGDQFARELVLGDHKGKLIELETDGIFVEMALIPNSKMVAHFVELDSFGRIKVDCGNRTNVPGIFAVGDVTSGFAEQVLIAVGEGAKAALSAYDYLLPGL